MKAWRSIRKGPERGGGRPLRQLLRHVDRAKVRQMIAWGYAEIKDIKEGWVGFGSGIYRKR